MIAATSGNPYYGLRVVDARLNTVGVATPFWKAAT